MITEEQAFITEEKQKQSISQKATKLKMKKNESNSISQKFKPANKRSVNHDIQQIINVPYLTKTRSTLIK